MKNLVKSYLVILFYLIIGTVVLVVFQQINLPAWLGSVFTLIVFLAINISGIYILKLNQAEKDFWALKKIHYLIWSILGGALIALMPTILKLVFGKSTFDNVHFNAEVSISGVLITFVIVGWEELWFRGLFLNYCKRYLSVTNISLTIGLLFMLVHTLNPEINLLVQGPGLFFAGALLTLLYFYYKSIWVPLGLHFGNNFFTSRIESGNSNDILFGEDGYIGAIILALIFVVFLIKEKKIP